MSCSRYLKVSLFPLPPKALIQSGQPFGGRGFFMQ